MLLYFHLTSIFTANLSLSADYLCLTLSDSLFHLWPAPTLLFTSSCLLHHFLLSSPLLMRYGLVWIDLLSSPPCFRRFFWDLRSSLWLQRYRLQRRSAVGEEGALAEQIHSCLLSLLAFYRLLSFAQFFFYDAVSYLSHTLLLFLSFPLSLFQDVDTIYHSQDNREFNLLDFSHLDSRWQQFTDILATPT